MVVLPAGKALWWRVAARVPQTGGPFSEAPISASPRWCVWAEGRLPGSQHRYFPHPLPAAPGLCSVLSGTGPRQVLCGTGRPGGPAFASPVAGLSLQQIRPSVCTAVCTEVGWSHVVALFRKSILFQKAAGREPKTCVMCGVWFWVLHDV